MATQVLSPEPTSKGCKQSSALVSAGTPLHAYRTPPSTQTEFKKEKETEPDSHTLRLYI